MLDRATTFEIICQRVSTRDYSDVPPAPALRARIEELTAGPHRGPLGATPRFAVLDFSEGGAGRSGRLGTYGLVSNARLLVAGTVARRDGHDHLHDYGYCLERIVLELTRWGLGTCWLEAFERRRLEQQLGVQPDELVPAVTVFGYPTATKSLRARAIKALAGPGRKPWPALFFETTSGRPLAAPSEAGPFREALEAVRRAPSAANRQPWRVFTDVATGEFDFYAKGSPKVDLGIAMAHFELVMGECGFGGQWTRQSRAPERPGLLYVASWRGLGE